MDYDGSRETFACTLKFGQESGSEIGLCNKSTKMKDESHKSLSESGTHVEQANIAGNLL